MKSKQNEIVFGLGFFAIMVGLVLLALSLVNDFTSTHFFENSPYMAGVIVTALGGITIAVFGKTNQKAL